MWKRDKNQANQRREVVPSSDRPRKHGSSLPASKPSSLSETIIPKPSWMTSSKPISTAMPISPLAAVCLHHKLTPAKPAVSISSAKVSAMGVFKAPSVDLSPAPASVDNKMDRKTHEALRPA